MPVKKVATPMLLPCLRILKGDVVFYVCRLARVQLQDLLAVAKSISNTNTTTSIVCFVTGGAKTEWFPVNVGHAPLSITLSGFTLDEDSQAAHTLSFLALGGDEELEFAMPSAELKIVNEKSKDGETDDFIVHFRGKRHNYEIEV